MEGNFISPKKANPGCQSPLGIMIFLGSGIPTLTFKKCHWHPGWEAGQSVVGFFSAAAWIGKVSALLDYMITKNFHCCGDQDLAFVVRMLADRYQLPHLVEEVDSQLENMLCKENVLSFFGRLLGTNSMLEAKCMKMLEVDGQRILEEHEATLDQITEETTGVFV